MRRLLVPGADSVALGDLDRPMEPTKAIDVAGSDIPRRMADAAIGSVALGDIAGTRVPRDGVIGPNLSLSPTPTSPGLLE